MVGPPIFDELEGQEFQHAGAKVWDGGEEEAEDDELESVSTVLAGHQPGWTMMERLYMFNGSFYVVS